MGDIVHLASVQPADDLINERFKAYRAALDRVNETRNVSDGIAAGRAWKAFLDIYMSEEQRRALRDPFTRRP